jgi:hypothetical protein
LIQDASGFGEHTFQENVPYNSTQLASPHRGADLELSLAQEMLQISMAGLRVAEQKVAASRMAEKKPPKLGVRIKVKDNCRATPQF